ncbi:MAG: DUF1684 domain-containing protein [Bacteroidetes bacterium]|nr:DUF1684 domain-containing protein [Bacteroidota bacterium]
MKKNAIIILLLAGFLSSYGQGISYADSAMAFRAAYINEHGAVKSKDRESLQFFPVNEGFRVKARFERLYGFGWFDMETSGTIKKKHRVYGILHFTLHDTTLQLRVYQSEQLLNTKEYKDWLFVPFTDKTSGNETYANGRYIDILTPELETGMYWLDFNKAYNPYCAYVSGKYNCPIPPAENDLPVAILAGEQKFAKGH